jgi:hypothetical protein
MAALFQRDRAVIFNHVRSVLAQGERTQEATVAENATVQTEGVRQASRDIRYDNLDVVISVGHRARPHRGTKFRIWGAQPLENSSSRVLYLMTIGQKVQVGTLVAGTVCPNP